MIIAFDLDEVICSRPVDVEHLAKQKYHHCYPNKNMIILVNRLFDEGHYIKIYTSRGMLMFNGNVAQIYSELFSLTTEQLKKWSLRYHELVMGKTHYDILIDDKVMNSINITYDQIVHRTFK